MPNYVTVPPLTERISREEAIERAREYHRLSKDRRYSLHNRYLAEQERDRYVKAFNITAGEIYNVKRVTE